MKDFINGLFAFSAVIFLALNCLDIWRRKTVGGQTVAACCFFTAYASWNVFFFSSLHQFWSVVGAVASVTINATMFSLVLRFRR